MSLNSMRNKILHQAWFKIGLWIVAVLMVVGIAFTGLGSNLGGGGRGLAAGAAAGNEVVATVNGDPISRAEYQQQVDSVRSQMQMFGRSIGAAQSAALHNFSLDQLITAKLELQQAKKLGLTASNAEIEKQREQIVTEQGWREKLGLKPTASLDDINAALAKAGAAPLDQRFPDDSVSQDVLLTKLQSYVTNQVKVSEQDARDSFQQWHTRHILIDNKKRSDAQAKVQAAQILAKAKAPGADFAALAKQYSDDPGTKAKGGDDGWIDQNTSYVPEFKKAAFALKPGEVTPDLVPSPQYGYFIIKLDAVRSNLPKDFEKNKQKYIAQVQQQKQQDAWQTFVGGLKSAPGTKIVVNDPALRGDQELADAQRAGDPVQQEAKYKAALADYQKALKSNASLSQTGEINASMAQAYQGLHQTPQAIAAYEAAVKATEDPELRMTLGQLYLDDNKPKEAAEQFQAASKQAWDDQSLHMNLLAIYTRMKRPDLVAQEQTWIKDYQARHQPTAAQSPPGASPAPTGVEAAPNTIKVVPSAGRPAKGGRKPTQ